jgi:thiamine-phosphate pyrophosphorylase
MLARSACQTGGVERSQEPSPGGGDGRRERLQSARLYLVCGAREDGFIESALRGGVDVVQLRLKGAADEEIVARGRRYAALCAAHGALFVLNDRPDLALEAGADGVHVGQDDAPVAVARELVGQERLVGLSTHTFAQVDAAREMDYIGVGPVHETPTKPGRPSVGLELVAYAAAHATVPFFAIGGLNERNVASVVGAGARRIAVVRALTESADPEAVARRLRRTLQGERQTVGAT